MHQLQPHIDQIVRTLEPLDFTKKTVPTPSIQAYYDHYKLNFDDVEHVFGMFQSGKYVLAAQVFKPHKPKGTIFLLHGYIDHTGLLQPLIRNCLEQGFVVAVYDFPGHGLSSGERLSIEYFSDYVSVFKDFLRFCQPQLPQPYHLISHSTGSAISLEYLINNETQHFERIIFLAPLVRHVHWHLSKVTYFLGKLVFVKTVPRRYSEISSDPEFLEFLRHDPLQTDRVPVKWIGALYTWERHIREATPISQPVFIIQGMRDTVVDAKYNIPFLQQKIDGVTIQWIEHAGHQLLNERTAIQTEVFTLINEYLTGGNH